MSSVNAIPGGDVDAMLLEQQRKDAALKAEAERIAKETSLLQKNVYRNSNPHPYAVVLILVLTIALIWLLYTMFVKPVASGEWIDTVSGNVWYVQHNTFTNNVRVVILDSNRKMLFKGCGRLNDGILKVRDIVGIWNYSDMILFVGGGGLQKVN